MRHVLLINLLLVSAAIGVAPPVPRGLTTTSTVTQTASASASDEIQQLVRQLGDRDYKTREAAHAALANLGEAALPVLALSIDDDNPEIARRVQMLMRRPDDPELRMHVVTRLIATTDPARVQMGVYWLFREPIVDYPLFKRATQEATGIRRAMFRPICDQLNQWRRTTELFERRQKELTVSKPDAAAHERTMQAESFYYQAEAAYWQALDAADLYRSTPSAARETSSQTAEVSSQPSGD